MPITLLQKLLLSVMAVSLPAIGLFYGAAPDVSLTWMFGFDASDLNLRHIFRAMMGLYFAMVALWIAGVMQPNLRLPALWSMVAFTGGIGSGRLLSLLLDGMPHPLLIIWMVLEFAIAATAYLLIVKDTRSAVKA